MVARSATAVAVEERCNRMVAVDVCEKCPRAAEQKRGRLVGVISGVGTSESEEIGDVIHGVGAFSLRSRI